MGATHTFVTITDIHASDITPRSRKDDFKETVLNKIRQVRDICTKRSAKGLLISGDLFNIKNPASNSHNLIIELIELFKSYPCPVYAIEGNHDITGNLLESISEQPLGVLFASGAIKRLRSEVLDMGHGMQLELIGRPYSENALEPLAPKADYSICLCHTYAHLEGGRYWKEKLYSYSELKELTNSNVFVLGHEHKDNGIEFVNGSFFINLGSLTRGTISDEDIQHKPKAGIIEVEVEEGDMIFSCSTEELKIANPEDVFNLEKKKEEIREKVEIKEFLNRLASAEISRSTVETKTPTTLLEGMLSSEKTPITLKVKEKVEHYITQAEIRKAGIK